MSVAQVVPQLSLDKTGDARTLSLGSTPIGVLQGGSFAIINKTYADATNGIVEGLVGQDDRLRNQSIIQGLLGQSGVVRLRAGSLISSAQIAPASYQSIVCDEGGAPPTLFAAASTFNNTDPVGGRYATNAVPLLVSGQTSGAFTPITGVTLENFTMLSEVGVVGRCLRAMLLRNAEKCRVLGVAFNGFPTGVSACLTGVMNSEFDITVLNMTDNFAGWSGPAYAQLTGMEFDNDLYNGRLSALNRVNLRVENITPGAAQMAAWGDQSDGLNIANARSSRNSFNLMMNGVNEGVDCFGNANAFTGVLNSCRGFGLKFIHGAQLNVADRLVITRPGQAGIVMAGGNGVGDVATKNNIVTTATISNVDPTGSNTAAGATTCAILFQPNGATSTTGVNPQQNMIANTDCSQMGPNAAYCWYDLSYGPDNIGKDIRLAAGSASSNPQINIVNGGGKVLPVGETAYITAR